MEINYSEKIWSSRDYQYNFYFGEFVSFFPIQLEINTFRASILIYNKFIPNIEKLKEVIKSLGFVLETENHIETIYRLKGHFFSDREKFVEMFCEVLKDTLEEE